MTLGSNSVFSFYTKSICFLAVLIRKTSKQVDCESTLLKPVLYVCLLFCDNL